MHRTNCISAGWETCPTAILYGNANVTIAIFGVYLRGGLGNNTLARWVP